MNKAVINLWNTVYDDTINNILAIIPKTLGIKGNIRTKQIQNTLQ